MSNSFEELIVYQKARTFRRDISLLVKTFPPEERFRLTDQLIRSSRSVAAQLAEGHGRFHYQENIQYCRISRGSLEETHEHLSVALDVGYIDEIQFENLLTQKTEILKILNGYITFLQKSKRENLT
jgi:four helix bundle protein